MDASCPATKHFLRRQVDMQIADIRLLFRLPANDLDPHVGCNLTAAAMMLNMISGFSRWFFTRTRQLRYETRSRRMGTRAAAHGSSASSRRTGHRSHQNSRRAGSQSAYISFATRSFMTSVSRTTRGRLIRAPSG